MLESADAGQSHRATSRGAGRTPGRVAQLCPGPPGGADPGRSSAAAGDRSVAAADQCVYRTPVVPLDDRYDMARHQMAWTGLLAVPGGVATGMAAVALHRIQGLPQRIPAEVCLPGGTSQRGPKGIRVRRYRSGMPVLEIGGFPVADVTVAIAQALRDLDREHGVAVLDSALHLGRLHAGTLREVNDLLVGCPGVRKARSYLVLADGRADSPLETWARLVFTDAGLPPSMLQKEF